jgi:hypothetical protein
MVKPLPYPPLIYTYDRYTFAVWVLENRRSISDSSLVAREIRLSHIRVIPELMRFIGDLLIHLPQGRNHIVDSRTSRQLCGERKREDGS